MSGIEIKRDYVSKKYKGSWADRVKKMPDYQVAAIYERMLDKDTRKAQEKKKKGEPGYGD